jgi:anti-sigma B factor antagonist
MKASPFEVRTENDGPAATVAIDGELDLATVDQLDAALAEVESNGATTVVLDLDQVAFMDSTGLRCLLRARRRAEQSGRRLRLVRVPPDVDRLFAVTGVSEVFHIDN